MRSHARGVDRHHDGELALRVIPATAGGVTPKLMDVMDIAALVEGKEAADLVRIRPQRWRIQFPADRHQEEKPDRPQRFESG